MTKYFATASGRMISFKKFTSEDIDLIDIAHHLANINRFGGALPHRLFYSVAQHSISLAAYLYTLTADVELARHALLHDASEAYLGDVVSALKDCLPDYQSLEKKVQSMIYQKFGVSLTPEKISKVEYYDKCILLDEVKYLIPDKYHLFAGDKFNPLNVSLAKYKTKDKTKEAFLWWFNYLTPNTSRYALG
jgi:5'-deoxynucleotidase YfbR-like HD superfamily hydrolase